MLAQELLMHFAKHSPSGKLHNTLWFQILYNVAQATVKVCQTCCCFAVGLQLQRGTRGLRNDNVSITSQACETSEVWQVIKLTLPCYTTVCNYERSDELPVALVPKSPFCAIVPAANLDTSFVKRPLEIVAWQ